MMYKMFITTGNRMKNEVDVITKNVQSFNMIIHSVDKLIFSYSQSYTHYPQDLCPQFSHIYH